MLAHARSSNQILIGIREGGGREWAISKKPVQEQWDATFIQEMKGTPGKPNPNKPGSIIPVHSNFDATDETGADGEVKPASHNTRYAEGGIHQRLDEAVYIKG